MCEHLKILEEELLRLNIKETFRGQAWSKNCREWVYYDCVIDTKAIMARLHLPKHVHEHTNEDSKSGLEHGLVCSKCKDAIMGLHPINSEGKFIFK
ncbi:hypothetical protein [Flagellimonas allohymeniacidonis]|uniref:Uncharacterized protein n=1 Tax=Flagellimonas allohymeniacidonis TaxID=2517819 RepID=A0A4Q8QB58_9FLAO|nr:hypothetical protein [Allomuricauda hymeniacidonis]TAI47582.1 hypothetical protein EW142_13020 [Allomuricauda hymeniacidonis]